MLPYIFFLLRQILNHSKAKAIINNDNIWSIINRCSVITIRHLFSVLQVFLRMLSPMLCICNRQCIKPVRPGKTPSSSPRMGRNSIADHAKTPDANNHTNNLAPDCLKDSTDSTEPLLSPSPSVTSPDIPAGTLHNGLDRVRVLERWLSRVEMQVGDVNKTIGRMLRLVENRRHETSHSRLLTQEWRLVAKVLDRLFVILYFVVIVFSILLLFPMPSNHFSIEWL